MSATQPAAFHEYAVTRPDPRVVSETHRYADKPEETYQLLMFVNDQGQTFILTVVAYNVEERDPTLKNMTAGRENLDSDDWPGMFDWYGKPGFTSVHCFYDQENQQYKAILGPRRLRIVPSPSSSRTPSPAGKGKGKAPERSTSPYPPGRRSRSKSRSPPRRSSRSSSPSDLWDPLQDALGFAVELSDRESILWGDGSRTATCIRVRLIPDRPSETYELLLKVDTKTGRNLLLNTRQLVKWQETNIGGDLSQHTTALSWYFGRLGYGFENCTLHTRRLGQPPAVILGPKSWRLDPPGLPSKPKISGTPVLDTLAKQGGYVSGLTTGAPPDRIAEWAGVKSRPEGTSAYQHAAPSVADSSYSGVVARNAKYITPSVAGSQYEQEWGSIPRSRQSSGSFGTGSQAPSVAGSVAGYDTRSMRRAGSVAPSNYAGSVAASHYTTYTQGGTRVELKRNYGHAQTNPAAGYTNTLPVRSGPPPAAAVPAAARPQQRPPSRSQSQKSASSSSSSSSSAGTVKASSSRPPPVSQQAPRPAAVASVPGVRAATTVAGVRRPSTRRPTTARRKGGLFESLGAALADKHKKKKK